MDLLDNYYQLQSGVAGGSGSIFASTSDGLAAISVEKYQTSSFTSKTTALSIHDSNFFRKKVAEAI